MSKARKKTTVSSMLPAGIRQVLRDCPDPTDPAALEYTAAILMAKIRSTGRALDAIIAGGDHHEILMASARVGRDLREDATVLRQIQQTLSDLAASRTTAPRDYRTETTEALIEDGPDGIRLVK